MLQGEHDQARSLIRQVLHAGADPRFWWLLAETNWHLYQADRQASRLTEARDALDRAIAGGLESTALTPGELTRLSQLKRDLAATIEN